MGAAIEVARLKVEKPRDLELVSLARACDLSAVAPRAAYDSAEQLLGREPGRAPVFVDHSSVIGYDVKSVINNEQRDLPPSGEEIGRISAANTTRTIATFA